VTDDLVSTLRAIVDRLNQLRIPYMVVGSIAALAHGRTRATQDFDLVIELDATRLRALAASLPSERFYFSEEAALDAVRRESMFNVVDLESGWKVDFVIRKRREFSRAEFTRRTELELLGLRIFVATLEDTIVAKLEWANLGGGSARQLDDVRELVALAGARLDTRYVEHWVNELGLDTEWRGILRTR